MAEQNTDIIIIGAGIAGLWTLKKLKEHGYDAVLLENDAIGAGQTIASQGIIHSGLKYALGGRISRLAKEISEMPARWKDSFGLDCMAAPSQQLLIPGGFMGGLAKAAGKNIFSVKETAEIPADIKAAGFTGSVLAMNEPVLDIPKVLRTMAAPLDNFIRKVPRDYQVCRDHGGNITGIQCGQHFIVAKIYIFTAAAGNEEIARQMSHARGLQIQERPLLMAMMKNAPFPLFAHFVGASDKPVATVTTHKTKDGALVWYVGGSVAERPKESLPAESFGAAKKAFAKYLPSLDLSGVEWAALPIDRVEGKEEGLWMPDTPTIHECQNALYCWPTKLTFAPRLADMVIGKLKNIQASGTTGDYSFLPSAPFAETPWDKAAWKKLN